MTMTITMKVFVFWENSWSLEKESLLTCGSVGYIILVSLSVSSFVSHLLLSGGRCKEGKATGLLLHLRRKE